MFLVLSIEYTTSFEEENLNGWTNVAAGTSGVVFTWTRGSGGTPSLRTGPNAAADGKCSDKKVYLFSLKSQKNLALCCFVRCGQYSAG